MNAHQLTTLPLRRPSHASSSWPEWLGSQSAEACRRDPSLLPETPGIYGLVLSTGAELLKLAGYPHERSPLLEVPEGFLMNVGCSHRLTLRARVLHHLIGTTRQSSFRRTVGSILRESGGLQPVGAQGCYAFRFDLAGEEWLTAYLRRTCHVFFAELPDPRAAEAWLIRTFKPPLNIKLLEREGFAQQLLELRRQTSLMAISDLS